MPALRHTTARRLRIGLSCLLIAGAGLAGCGKTPERPQAQAAPAPPARPEVKTESALVGSKTCRDCHESFYHLWATSRHGLAMQPYSPGFARKALTDSKNGVVIGSRTFTAEVGPDAGQVRETTAQGEKTYPIVHVLGGKNAYYFLTPFDRGRLQVLPIAYDVNKKTWYDTAASGVRHFPDRHDEALDWTDRLFTFNTTCFNCHVSELATNYDLSTDTYHTTWAEPGISCESCHGPAREHVRTMEEGEPKGHGSADIKIIRTKEFTPAQMNDMCATCHAKLIPLSTTFQPRDRFFDHFDLVTLDHPDFYPDGRDLGENYTFTSWMMSPCVAPGQLDCNHCHTASGRPRYEGNESNRSCLPCHKKIADEPVAHGHHAAGSVGNRCVSCHMPTTRFAAMARTDHSMRPPTPAATREFQSPNACNLCHADKDAAWADGWVRKWYPRDYQAPVLARARLLDAARHDRWQELPALLARLGDSTIDPVWKTSLVRLLRGTNDAAKWPALRQRLGDPSPLVRSAAVTALGDRLSEETLPGLLAATRDESRLVRIRAAQSLAGVSADLVRSERDRSSMSAAVAEFLAAMSARPDDWSTHANLGNFQMDRRAYDEAVRSFETASRLEPRVIGPMVNAALAYSNLNRTGSAETCLRKALAIEPANASVNFNLGLLLGEQGRVDEAEQALRTALKTDPKMAAAAYNLGVIVARKNVAEAVTWCRQAHQLEPDDPKYVQSLAFYQRQGGDRPGAIATLKPWLARHPLDVDACLLLGQVYEEQGDRAAAAGLLRETLGKEGLPAPQRAALARALEALEKAR
jgi:Flp pilus assembly protein TadD